MRGVRRIIADLCTEQQLGRHVRFDVLALRLCRSRGALAYVGRRGRPYAMTMQVISRLHYVRRRRSVRGRPEPRREASSSNFFA